MRISLLKWPISKMRLALKPLLKGTPVGIRLRRVEDLVTIALPCWFMGVIRRPRKSGPTVCFYPGRPFIRSSMFRLMLFDRFSFSYDPSQPFDLLVHWDAVTVKTGLPSSLASKRGVNIGVTDVSKSLLDEHHERILGYKVAVDPLTFEGEGVIKSEANGVHDGKVVRFPVQETEPGLVYQRLVDNVVDGKYAEDIRIVVIGERMPVVYLKYRHIHDRFDHYIDKMTKVVDPDEVLTVEEQNFVLRISKAIGMDFGEIDALRDRRTGQLFIVDANDTPTGPADGLSVRDYWKTLNSLSVAFREQFLA